MPRRGTWVFAPDSGGKHIPEPVKVRTEQRIRRYTDVLYIAASRYTSYTGNRGGWPQEARATRRGHARGPA
jgi:hypothetical protein